MNTPRSLRVGVTTTAIAAIALPLLGIAAGAAMHLRNEAMRFENAPVKSNYLCLDAAVGVDTHSTPPQDFQPREIESRCEKWRQWIGLDSKRIGDYYIRDVADADKDIRITVRYTSDAHIPELSFWPFTVPDAIRFRHVADTGTKFRSGSIADLDPRRAGLIAAMQREFNHQVLSLFGGALLMTALFGWMVWLATGRVLRPVEEIRRQMAEITEHDLSRRVTVPRSRNEIAVLANTVNTTLRRLQHALDENRRFVADASHELRSPIAALRAELEIATAHPGQADWPAVVDAALADTDRLQQLATDLLLLARLDHAPATAHTTTVDLTTLVAEHTTHRRTRHALATDLPDHPAPVHGRRALLERLLGNLLDNAERHATTTITVHLATSDEHVVLEVRDDGPGIPPDDRERVFDRFTRLDDARTRDTGGTGLGLPIARRIATAHHGTLHVTDDPDHPGARLVATLPLGRDGAPRDGDTGRSAFDG